MDDSVEVSGVFAVQFFCCWVFNLEFLYWVLYLYIHFEFYVFCKFGFFWDVKKFLMFFLVV